MKIEELIERLQRMPKNAEVVKFDGENIENVSMVYVYPGGIYDIKGKVVVD